MPQKCSVPGCSSAAEYRVMLYDFYPRIADVFIQQDHTCPFICREHADKNERDAHGERRPRGSVGYPYTNQEGAQGFTIYLPLREV